MAQSDSTPVTQLKPRPEGFCEPLNTHGTRWKFLLCGFCLVTIEGRPERFTQSCSTLWTMADFRQNIIHSRGYQRFNKKCPREQVGSANAPQQQSILPSQCFRKHKILLIIFS